MQNTRRSTWFFLGALFFVALLAVLPPSGWLLRNQFRLIGGREVPGISDISSDSAASERARRIRAVAAARPDDYPIQLAAALESAPPPAAPGEEGEEELGDTLRRLLSLWARFNDRPGLHAHIWCSLYSGDHSLHIGRLEENVLSQRRQSPALPLPESRPYDPRLLGIADLQPVDPLFLAIADAEAGRGEALDPQNAFFPTMRAIELLASYRDTEAVAALQRAAAEPKWDDYSGEVVQARWVLSEALYGRTGAMSDLAIQAGVDTFGDSAALRDLARETIGLAVLHEQAGDIQGGFAMRRAIARIGATMRAQSPTINGSLTGETITAIAASRPGGAPPVDPKISGEERAAIGQARYVSYLTRIGHPEEASWYVAERRAAERSQTIFRRAGEETSYGMRPFLWLAGWWGTGLLLLVNALWTLLFGGLAALLARTARVRESLPLHRGVRWGFVLAVLFPAAAGMRAFLAGSPGGSDDVAFCLEVGCIAFLALPFLLLKRGEDWHGCGRNIAVCLGTVAACAALVALGAASMGFGRAFAGNFDGMIGSSADGSSDTSAVKIASGALLAGFALAVPLLTLIVLAIRSRIRRMPVSVGVVRGFRAAALPTAGVLLLLYAAVVGGTLIQERNVEGQMRQSLVHEGRYDAALIGEEWPGPVSVPSATK